MAHRFPWMKWFVSDWKKDDCVRKADMLTKGTWRELLDDMHLAEERDPCGEACYSAIGTVEQLARSVGILPAEMALVVLDLDRLGIAEVSIAGAAVPDPAGSRAQAAREIETCDAEVTIINRRRLREFRARAAGRARSEKSRARQKSGGDPPEKSAAPAAAVPHQTELLPPPPAAAKPEDSDDVKEVLEHWRKVFGRDASFARSKHWIAARLGLKKLATTDRDKRFARYSKADLIRSVDLWSAEKKKKRSTYDYHLGNFFNETNAYFEHYLEEANERGSTDATETGQEDDFSKF